MPRGVKKENLPSKICAVCNRPFTWRKKWERCWDEVRTCSDRCKTQDRRQRQSQNQKGKKQDDHNDLPVSDDGEPSSSSPDAANTTRFSSGAGGGGKEISAAAVDRPPAPIWALAHLMGVFPSIKVACLPGTRAAQIPRLAIGSWSRAAAHVF